MPDEDPEAAHQERVLVMRVVVDPSEDVPKRHELQVEWITNRMNFLLASQAFLIAAYIALLVENRDSEIVKQVEIKDYWIKMIPKISLLHVVAMSISILAAQNRGLQTSPGRGNLLRTNRALFRRGYEIHDTWFAYRVMVCHPYETRRRLDSVTRP